MTKKKKLTNKRQKPTNPYFTGIRDGLTEVLGALEKGEKLTCHQVSFPAPPEPMAAEEIIDLRENQLHLSQQLFAYLLNVSVKTVQAWEQAINAPGGASLRLLWLAREKPDVFRSILSPQN
ncbi:MAG: hypothetical protein JW709_14045 [Sedimentisphaerales bacterium]|nr:hypothetical protein [Sedimentisphaerales bacterium]